MFYAHHDSELQRREQTDTSMRHGMGRTGEMNVKPKTSTTLKNTSQRIPC